MEIEVECPVCGAELEQDVDVDLFGDRLTVSASGGATILKAVAADTDWEELDDALAADAWRLARADISDDQARQWGASEKLICATNKARREVEQGRKGF